MAMGSVEKASTISASSGKPTFLSLAGFGMDNGGDQIDDDNINTVTETKIDPLDVKTLDEDCTSSALVNLYSKSLIAESDEECEV